MRNETISSCVSELRQEYSGAAVASEDDTTLVKLPGVRFPKGCKPHVTEALVLLKPGEPQPTLLLRAVPTLPNGVQPRSVSAVTVAGETWFSFSYSMQWDESTHSALQFVEGRLRRFGLSE